jgi:hypothetical protein
MQPAATQEPLMKPTAPSAPITIALTLPPEIAQQFRDWLLPDLQAFAERLTLPNEASTTAQGASTVPLVAKRINRSNWYVHNEIRKGRLKAFRPSPSADYMVTDAALDEWVAAGQVKPCRAE